MILLQPWFSPIHTKYISISQIVTCPSALQCTPVLSPSTVRIISVSICVTPGKSITQAYYHKGLPISPVTSSDFSWLGLALHNMYERHYKEIKLSLSLLHLLVPRLPIITSILLQIQSQWLHQMHSYDIQILWATFNLGYDRAPRDQLAVISKHISLSLLCHISFNILILILASSVGMG